MCKISELYYTSRVGYLHFMHHRGELVEKAIRQSGYSITRVAAELGKSRRWMYYVFENRDLNMDLILEIGQIIHYDFSKDFREFKLNQKNLIEDMFKEYPRRIGDQKKEIEHWKNKYLEILEKYNKLLTASSPKNKTISKTKR